MKPQSPCLECEEREIGCHAQCEKYEEYRSELEAWKQTVKAKKEEGAEASKFRQATFVKLEKTRGRKV